jgi:hypothetical protein
MGGLDVVIAQLFIAQPRQPTQVERPRIAPQ